MGIIFNRRRVMGSGGSQDQFIQFADSNTKSLCVALWGGADGGTAPLNTRVNNVKVSGVDGELTYEQASSIKSMAAGQFQNNTTITSFDELQYFTGLTTINSNAFNGCSALVSIAIPSSLTSTSVNVFIGCSSLAAVHISDLEAWCNISFGNMNSNPLVYGYHHLYLNGVEIKDLVIPNTVTTIKNFAFKGGSSFTSLTLHSSITSIGQYAFANCSGLQTLNLPNSVTSIGSNAFDGCRSLTSVTIPNNAVTFGSYVFANCTSLTSVTIPPNVMSISANMFSSCSLLSTVDLGNITVIPSGAFFATIIQNIDLSKVTSVGSDAFRNGKLVDVDLSSVVTIDNLAFYSWDQIDSVLIGENCTTITGNMVFSGKRNVFTMTVKATTPPTLSAAGLGNVTAIYVPAASVDTYKAANYWSSYASIIQAIPT